MGALVVIFIGTFVLNRKTPAPMINEAIDLKTCSTCKIATCAYHGGDAK
jgi:hypothetical protein